MIKDGTRWTKSVSQIFTVRKGIPQGPGNPVKMAPSAFVTGDPHQARLIRQTVLE